MVIFVVALLGGIWMLAAFGAWMDGHSILAAILGSAAVVAAACVSAAAVIAGLLWALRDDPPRGPKGPS
jgi:hypothetical protein